jgi:hypothetical protein
VAEAATHFITAARISKMTETERFLIAALRKAIAVLKCARRINFEGNERHAQESSLFLALSESSR